MQGSGRPASHISWDKAPGASERIARDAALQANENAIHIVKVIVPEDSFDNEAIIYRQNRLWLKHQKLTDEQVSALGADRRGHYRAQWSKADVCWTLIEPVKGHSW